MRGMILLASAIAFAAPATAADVGTAVKADMPSLIAIYRDLHAHPELSSFFCRMIGPLSHDHFDLMSSLIFGQLRPGS